jgi:hypothetical protein
LAHLPKYAVSTQHHLTNFYAITAAFINGNLFVEKQEHNPFLTIELTPSQSIEQLELVLINNT